MLAETLWWLAISRGWLLAGEAAGRRLVGRAGWRCVGRLLGWHRAGRDHLGLVALLLFRPYDLGALDSVRAGPAHDLRGSGCRQGVLLGWWLLLGLGSTRRALLLLVRLTLPLLLRLAALPRRVRRLRSAHRVPTPSPAMSSCVPANASG